MGTPAKYNFSPSWHRAWRQLSAADNADLRDNLLARYAEPQRHYHTQQHLGECLVLFDTVRHLAAHPEEIELALWFHDAIYDIPGADNEARSADWARSACLGAGVEAGAAERIHKLVMATRHDAVPREPDAQLLVDIDLAILGADTDRFDEYERQIRQEYNAVSEALFRSKRGEILQSLVDRPRLYSTAHFHAALEDRARANLRRSIGAAGG